jgi:hypothetical protein
MNKILGILLTLLVLNDSFGQNQESIQKICVINLLGAKVYDKPTFNSKIVTELQVGEMIIIEKSIDSIDSIKIGKGFSLKGFWIKPKAIKGFVFSSDFTDKKVEVGINKHGQTFINLLGNLLEEKVEEKIVKTEKGEFPKYNEFKYYENGTYSYTAWDGCFDHITKYENLNLSEVYHQMVSDYSGLFITSYGKDLWIPVFQEKSGNVIKFEGEGATQDLQIEIFENGKFAVSSYDCT